MSVISAMKISAEDIVKSIDEARITSKGIDEIVGRKAQAVVSSIENEITDKHYLDTVFDSAFKLASVYVEELKSGIGHLCHKSKYGLWVSGYNREFEVKKVLGDVIYYTVGESKDI